MFINELNYRFYTLTYAAGMALIRLQGVQVFPLLIESMRTPGHRGISTEIVEAIGTVGEPSIPTLRDILNFDGYDYLSETAVKALKTIGTTESLTVVKQWERGKR